MTKDQQVNAALPDFPGDIPSVAAYRSMTTLEKFVYDWQPGDRPDEWRRDLTAVLREALAPPTAAPADDVRAALTDLVTSKNRKIDALEERLEIQDGFPGIDGITCRDETISLLDEKIAEMEAKARRDTAP